jgi:predicted RNA-binding Zn-ribbon protein involved in translation (DUF1610 family)
VRLPWQAREYERVCANCGYTWRVPRQFAHRRVQSISGMSVASRTTIDRSELEQEVESDMAVNEEVESFATCPRCGWDRYTQHAIRS